MDPFYFFRLLVAGAALLIIIGKAKDSEEKTFRKNGIQTRGVVIENRLCWGEFSVVRPVVQFTTEHGEVVQALDENGMALAMLRLSECQPIILIYSKLNPRSFRITTKGNFA